MLTDDNPTMAYGVQTVSGIARVINQDLNSRLALRLRRARGPHHAGRHDASQHDASQHGAGQGGPGGQGR